MESLYRKCSEKEILSFLKNKFLIPNNGKKFISFSKEIIKKSGTQAKKDTEYIVEYSYDKILSQGGIEVIYDWKFLRDNLDIATHISGAESLNIFLMKDINIYSWNRIDGTPLEKALDYLAFWRASEKEVVIDKLYFESGLIKNISKINNEKVSINIINQLKIMSKK